MAGASLKTVQLRLPAGKEDLRALEIDVNRLSGGHNAAAGINGKTASGGEQRHVGALGEPDMCTPLVVFDK